MDGVSHKHPTHEPNDYFGEPVNKGFESSPDSLIGCIGYFNKKRTRCQKCEFLEICKKVVPRNEVEKLLQEILELVAQK